MSVFPESVDVIVVGGRPAGATLAARLGRYGFSVLLVDRATFPSLPAASSPMIYAPTMTMLDEIGADEADYARNTPQIRQLSLHGNVIQSNFPIPEDGRRDYAYAIDRARFDHSLWCLAAKHPNVTAFEGFHVSGLLRDGERVTGVRGKAANGEPVEVRSRLVIGADGRFSLVARTVNAAERDGHSEYATSLLYAYWEGVAPYPQTDEPASVAYEGTPGIGYLVMDSADNTTAVVIEGRADSVKPGPGKAESFYLDMLRQNEALWSRMGDAQMVTDVRGMRRVGNFYREAGGPGWALVGDAYHQKDPLDGQGIYNAVFTAKALAWAIRDWHNGDRTWSEAVEWYDETARIKTYAMYKSVINRVRASLYAEPSMPPWLEQSLARWMLEDPAVSQLFGRFVARQIPADAMRLMTPPLMVNAMIRGGLRDVRRSVRDRIRTTLPF